MCTRASIALRAVFLCDLALQRLIDLDSSGIVRVMRQSEKDMEEDFIYRIGQCSYAPKQLLRALNGEFSKSLAIKNLRSKLFKELETKRILHVKKALIYNRLILDDFTLWSEIHNRIQDECRSSILSTESKVLLVALNYINRMESLLLQCNEGDAASIIRSLADIQQSILKGAAGKDEKLIFAILENLIK